MDRVLEYLNTGEVIALIGAGVSAEVGIPPWRKFCADLLASVPPSAAYRMEEAQHLIERERYAELCGWIAQNLGDEFLYENARRLLKDTNRNGKVAGFIAQFPFKSVFTTNFDDSLARHFVAVGKAMTILGNSEEDLAAVDVDIVPSIVKLHSDLDHTGTLILTDAQYSRAIHSGSFSYLREFLGSYFANRRILMIGYSISDPDIIFLLERLAQNLRRKVPIYAIVADASPLDASKLKQKLNIEVISYHNTSGTHRELVALFEALSPFLDTNLRKQESIDLDLRRAQSLYLWSRFGLAEEGREAQVDAIKSVILYQLQEGQLSQGDLERKVGDYIGLIGKALSDAVSVALDSLLNDGYVNAEAEKVSLTEKAVNLEQRLSRQHDRLRDAFISQVQLDLERAWPDASDEIRTHAVEVILNVLVSIFDERGVEMVNTLFGNSDASGRRSARLFGLLNAAGRELGDEDKRFRLISYVCEIITNPSEAQKNYLEHLAIAFFSLNALAMDPDGNRFRTEFLGGRRMILDSNILIPMLPLRGTFEKDFRGLVELAQNAGIQTITTHGFIEEVYQHGIWARELEAQYGPHSIEVLQAAKGEGFRRNAFLDGFVLYSVDERTISFNNYLAECVRSDAFTRKAIQDHLASTGIPTLEFSEISETKQNAFVERDETAEYIRGQAEDRDIEKSDNRISAEAEAYSIISNLGEPKTGAAPLPPTLLSQGGFLNRVARFGPYPLHRPIVTPPDALYGFLLKTGSVPPSGLSFRELIVSPFFDTSSHFVDKVKYRTFFSALINDADRIYREHLETFQDEIDTSLTPEFFDDIEPLDRPYFVAAFQEQLEARIEEKDRKLAEREAQVHELTAALEEEKRKTSSAEKRALGAAAAKERKERKAAARRSRRRRK